MGQLMDRILNEVDINAWVKQVIETDLAARGIDIPEGFEYPDVSGDIREKFRNISLPWLIQQLLAQGNGQRLPVVMNLDDVPRNNDPNWNAQGRRSGRDG